jgi:hypothetical protein
LAFPEISLTREDFASCIHFARDFLQPHWSIILEPFNVLKSRPVELVEILPHTIRCTSHQVEFWGLRVVLRELHSIGRVKLPVVINHFFLAFRPVEAPSAMEVEFKNTDERCLVDRSLQFFSPGRRHTAQWRGAEGVVTHFTSGRQ